MKLFSSKRRVIAAAALVLLALFLLRPGASRLKSRIISSLSAAGGRSVDVGSVHIRLLPRPGFDLENLVVYDDPAFGAEPMLRASEVTADLRLMSLVRGRIEIARLDLTEPSLNLVHSEGGRWNLEALLEHTSHTPLAPTGKAKSEPRPGFPYIEGTSARINFKSGPEKKSYALTNADFSLWQDSENTWGLRLKAQPVRTDLNLNDTGLLQVSGTWQRAASFRDTPLQLSMEWSRAQLGQVTKLFTGSDKGWRGAILLDLAMSGNPAKLQISTTASIDDFRRYDITAGKALRLTGSCAGEYSILTHEFREVKCSAPVAKGLITVTGEMGLPGSHRYSVAVTAENVPASSVVALAQRAKKNLPEDLVAAGRVDGKFSLEEDAAAGVKRRLEGRGEIEDFRLSSAASSTEVGPETIPFVLVSDTVKVGAARGRDFRGPGKALQFPEGPHIEFGSPARDATHAGNAAVRGWIDPSGYDIAFAGEIEIARALRIARMIGVPALAANPEGAAQVDLQTAGAWASQDSGASSGFVAPQVTGTAKLKNAKVTLNGTGGPVEIVSAEMELLPDTVRVEKLNAKAAGAAWMGSLTVPRGCGTPENCPVRFALNTGDATLGQLREWASPSPKKRPWYQVLAGSAPAPSLLARLHASGGVTVERLKIHAVTAMHVSTSITLDDENLQISAVNADLLGGNYRGKWQVDFRSKPAICTSSGNLTGLALASVAAAMKDAWIAGTANGSYELTGACSGDFWQSVDGTVRAEMRDGVLPNVSIGEETAPLRVTRLKGRARVHGGSIEIEEAQFDSPGGKYQLSGTATLQRQISLKIARTSNGAATGGYAITGTLAEPRITPLAGTEQARLKTPHTK